MMAHAFRIACVPPKTTHQTAMRIFQNKEGRAFLGKSSKGKRVETELLSLLLPHRPAAPLVGPLSLECSWVYPYRKSEPKKNRGGLIPCPTRPDCDNLAKFLCDCMERAGFFETGDAQVTTLTFGKWWGPRPGIEVDLYQL